MDDNNNLGRQLGLVSALSVVIGIVLGAGAFMKPPQILALAGSTNMALLAWVIGGVVSMAGGLTLCELAVRYPQTGGIYIYLQKIYGEKTAYLYAWTVVFLYGTAAIAAFASYFSSVFCFLFGVSPRYQMTVGLAVLGLVLVVNSISVKAGGRMQIIVTICKMTPVLLLIFAGVAWGKGQVLNISWPAAPHASFAAAVLATFYAYDGWSQLTSLAGEIKNPSRNLPRAIIGGIIFLVCVYIAINCAFLTLMPPEKIIALGHDASVIIAQQSFGLYGGNLLALAIMIALLGGANGLTMAISRVLYTLGSEKRIVGHKYIAKVDEKGGSPVVSMVIVAIISAVYCAFFDADRLTNIVMFAIWVFYCLAFVGAIINRRRHALLPGEFRMPLYPLTPVVAICGALFAMYGMLSYSTQDSVMAIIITLLGFPVYYLSHSQRPLASFSKLRAAWPVTIAVLLIVCGSTLFVWKTTTKVTLTVGTEPSIRPFTFTQDGQIEGYDIDVIRRACVLAGYDIQINPVAFQYLIDAVHSDFVQVAACALTPTEERSKLVNFTQAYFEQGDLSVMVPDRSGIREITGLTGRRIGTQKGTTAEQQLARLSGTVPVAFQTVPDMLEAYNRGDLDGILYMRQSLQDWINNGTVKHSAIIANVAREHYAFAVSKDNKQLLQDLNKALERMQASGELEELRQKWFGPNK